MKKHLKTAATLMCLLALCAAGQAAGYAEEELVPEEEILEELCPESLVSEEEENEPLREEESFTLTFVYNNGTEDTLEVIVPAGEATVEPAEPEWEGHLFEGWYNDPVVGRQFVFGEALNMDRTLYAHWSVNDWKISTWFTELVRGGSNIAYDPESRTLAFGAGELILNRAEDGYYLGFRITAPNTVTEDGERWRIEMDGEWHDFNGPEGICDGTENGCLYLDVYEALDLNAIKKLADQNARTYKSPSHPVNREDLTLEEASEESGGGRRGGRADSGGDTEEEEFVPILMEWRYRLAKAGEEESADTVLTVTLDPRFPQFRDGQGTAFAITGYYYRYRVKLNPLDGTPDSDLPNQVVVFGNRATEPTPAPEKNGYLFAGWYPGWKDKNTGEVFYAEWPYDFDEGVRSAFTLYAKWEPISFETSLNLSDYTGINVYVGLPEGEDAGEYSIEAEYESYRQAFTKGPVVLGSLPRGSGERAGMYKFEVLRAASTEMSDKVTVRLKKGEKTVKTEEYSVRSIAEARLEAGGDDEDTETLLRALLQLGYYGQLVFHNKEDDLPDITEAPELVPIPEEYMPENDPADFGAYVAKFEGKLDLNAATSMNLYLTPAAGYGRQDFDIRVLDRDGKPYSKHSVTETGGKIRVRIEGILSPQLGRDFRVVVTLKSDTARTAAWTRSVLSCGWEKQQDADENVQSLMQALYQYKIYAARVFPDFE